MISALMLFGIAVTIIVGVVVRVSETIIDRYLPDIAQSGTSPQFYEDTH